MPAPRFRLLEAIFAVLLVAGCATALAGDKLGNDATKTVGLIAVFLGAIVFGLDMVVQRRTLDRLVAMFVIIPLGFAIVGWGALTTVAPSVAEEATSWVKSAVAQRLDALK